MYVRGIDFPSASTICLLNFGIAPTMLHFFFHFIAAVRVRVMVFSATLNNIFAISWWSVLLVRDHTIVYTRE